MPRPPRSLPEARNQERQNPFDVFEPMTPEQKKSNRRLGLVLGTIAVLVFIGFMLKGALGGL